MIVLEIPRVPPSPNHLLGAHWFHRHKNQSLWRDEVCYALHQAGHSLNRVPFARAAVRIERRSRGELDPDNLVGCVKPVIDGLRYANVLLDDTPAHLQLTVTQCRGKPRTHIEIQPL